MAKYRVSTATTLQGMISRLHPKCHVDEIRILKNQGTVFEELRALVDLLDDRQDITMLKNANQFLSNKLTEANDELRDVRKVLGETDAQLKKVYEELASARSEAKTIVRSCEHADLVATLDARDGHIQELEKSLAEYKTANAFYRERCVEKDGEIARRLQALQEAQAELNRERRIRSQMEQRIAEAAQHSVSKPMVISVSKVLEPDTEYKKLEEGYKKLKEEVGFLTAVLDVEKGKVAALQDYLDQQTRICNQIRSEQESERDAARIQSQSQHSAIQELKRQLQISREAREVKERQVSQLTKEVENKEAEIAKLHEQLKKFLEVSSLAYFLYGL